MFKVGDIINYSFFTNVKIVAINDSYYTLMDSYGNKKAVYRSLVDKYGKLVK